MSNKNTNRKRQKKEYSGHGKACKNAKPWHNTWVEYMKKKRTTQENTDDG
jgi:hypothetical protein